MTKYAYRTGTKTTDGGYTRIKVIEWDLDYFEVQANDGTVYIANFPQSSVSAREIHVELLIRKFAKMSIEEIDAFLEKCKPQ